MATVDEAQVAAALIDVGGTLWAEHPVHLVDVNNLRIERLCKAVPTLDRAQADRLRRELLAWTSRLENDLVLDIGAVIRDVTTELRLPIQEQDIDAIRAAISIPMGGIAELLVGARELLETVKELNLRCIIASNTMFRRSQGYRQDFQDLGLLEYIDGIVTSVDVGFRKPHLAMFEAARALAGCDASQCVFIGNSERNDVQPAVSLGMRVIRVAIEEPAPSTSAANAVVTFLTEAAQFLETWAGNTFSAAK